MQKQSTNLNPQRTVLTIVTGFLVIYLITGWQWVVILALCMGLASVLSTRLAVIIHWVWMEIARLLGLVVPKIILTFVYYLVLVPVALLSKIFRKEPPVILENKESTMFRDMHKTFRKEDFLRPW